MTKKSLKEILTADIFTVTPSTQLPEAMQIILREDISCLLVLDDGKLVGILTERKIVHYAAQLQAGLEEIEVSELMSSPVYTAEENIELY
jgi:CBS domain-containing protein